MVSRFWKSASIAAALCLGAWQSIAFAAPVEYVKVCSLSGIGYFYIPGTDNCVDADAIDATQQALSSFSTKAFTGVAISTAMVAPYIPNNANYAISVHWGGYQGDNAVGFGALARVSNTNFFLSAGVGAGLAGGPVGERAGFMFAW